MNKEKWLNYAIGTLKACSSGAGSIAHISSDINSPPAYTAKVVADLRRARLIDENYELVRPPQQITVRQVIEASEDNDCQGPAAKINAIILKSLEVPITQVW